MCFTEPKWRFLNDKHHKVSNFYGLPKIHKSMVIESAINTQNKEIIGTVMGTIFRPIYANLTMGYEIKVYCIININYALASKHFPEFLVQIFKRLSNITES